MTYEDTVKLLTMAQRLYPTQIKMTEPKEFELTCKLWERCLWNIDFSSCAEALIIHGRMSSFAPSPSHIIEIVHKKHFPDLYKSGEMAWEEVSRAVRVFGFNGQSEAFKLFDDQLKRAVKAIGWWNICYNERPDMVKKDFIAFWENVKTSEREAIKVDHTKWLVEQEKLYLERQKAKENGQ